MSVVNWFYLSVSSPLISLPALGVLGLPLYFCCINLSPKGLCVTRLHFYLGYLLENLTNQTELKGEQKGSAVGTVLGPATLDELRARHLIQHEEFFIIHHRRSIEEFLGYSITHHSSSAVAWKQPGTNKNKPVWLCAQKVFL